jgi:hypothetical protein
MIKQFYKCDIDKGKKEYYNEHMAMMRSDPCESFQRAAGRCEAVGRANG